MGHARVSPVTGFGYVELTGYADSLEGDLCPLIPASFVNDIAQWPVLAVAFQVVNKYFQSAFVVMWGIAGVVSGDDHIFHSPQR